MKLWKITHHHPRALPGASVHLFPSPTEPTEAEVVNALKIQVEAAQGESIRIEYTGYQVAPFYTDLLDAARNVLSHLEKGDLNASALAVLKLDKAAQDAARAKPRSLIFVGGGMVTDVFSTERAMEVSILDAQDMKDLGFALDSVDEAIKAGTSALYRIL